MITLTRVGINGPGVGIGTDPNGNRVRFRLTPSDEADLRSVLFSDLAINFSGVEIDPADLLTAEWRCDLCGAWVPEAGTCECGTTEAMYDEVGLAMLERRYN